jgi:uncharacterized protein YeaO (DUF488 family)
VALDRAARGVDNEAVRKASGTKTRRKVPEAARESSSPVCFLHELEPAATAAGQRDVRIKRIYEPAEATDGYRALIDRLWPRGISRQRAALDAWLVELAPSSALRTWFGHDPKRWSVFARRYRAELHAQREALEALRHRAERMRVTLLTATREPRINHAAVLRAVLLRSTRRRASKP